MTELDQKNSCQQNLTVWFTNLRVRGGCEQQNTQCFGDKGGQSVSAYILCLIITANVSLCGPGTHCSAKTLQIESKMFLIFWGVRGKNGSTIFFLNIYFFCLMMMLLRINLPPHQISQQYLDQHIMKKTIQQYLQKENLIRWEMNYRQARGEKDTISE